MGLILLTNKNSNIQDQFQSVTYLPAKRNDKLQIQGLVVRLTNGIKFGFIYCRSSPTNPDILKINKHFSDVIICNRMFKVT